MRAGGFNVRTATQARFAGLIGVLVAALAVLLVAGSSAVAFGTAAATIQTKASPSVSVGGTISDSAQALGSTSGGGVGLGAVPTGTLVFTLYGPNDANCSMSPVYTSSAVPLMAQGGIVATAASGNYTVPMNAPGTYRFVVSYSGDSNYAPQTSMCGEASETVQVTAATPKLTTVASPGTQVGDGGVLTDTATLSGGKAPTGSITFLLFPPSDPTCSGNLVDAKSTVAVSDPNPTVSQPFTPSAAGTYHWVALYTGDTQNAAVNGACTDPGEAVTVTAAPAGSTPPAGTTPGSTSPAATGPCNPVATANAVLNGIVATLTGKPGSVAQNSCSAGVRIVLRAKEIRPGNSGIPRHDGFTTMANVLTHIAPSGPLINFSLSSAGEALRTYALSHNRSLTAFLIVHIRPDKTTNSTESLQILTLG